MRNASKMARYMMMRTGREGADRGGNYGARNTYPDMRMGDYERETEVRNGYGGYGNEGGNYARDNYGVDNRFRDRRGREHYDNGRFAPRNDLGNVDGDYYGPYSRNEPYGERSGAERREREVRPQNEREMHNRWDGGNEGGRMNVIGFDRPQEMQSHYPTRIDYAQGDEMERRPSMKMAGGAMGAEMALTPEIAKEWVKGMHNEDGTRGEHWNMEQVKKLMAQKGIEFNAAEVYAIINALYSDFCKVFKKYNITSPEFYLDLAVAWLNDTDAKPGKAMNYYECIVK